MKFFAPQVEYMNSLYPGFKKAQAAGSAQVAGGDTHLEVFWKGIKAHFLQEWPTPQAEQEAAKRALLAWNAANPKKKKTLSKSLASERPVLEGEALRKWREEREERVMRWFYNHDSTVKGSFPELKVELAAPRESSGRALTRVQLYSKEFYTKRVKENVDKAVAAQSKAPEKKEMLDIITKVTADTFANESPEILARIDELEAAAAEERRKTREILKNAFVDDYDLRVKKDEPPEVYCRHINALDAIFQGLLPVLARKTGWSFSVICGGPDPMKPDGEIRTRSYHEGRNMAGVGFSKAHPTFQTSYVNPYSAFLHTVYPAEVRQSRVLKSALAGLMTVMNRPTAEEALLAEDATSTSKPPAVAGAVSTDVSSPPDAPPVAIAGPSGSGNNTSLGVHSTDTPPIPVVLGPVAPTATAGTDGVTRTLVPGTAPSVLAPSGHAGDLQPSTVPGGVFDDLGRLMDETRRLLHPDSGAAGGEAALEDGLGHLALRLQPAAGSLEAGMVGLGAVDYRDLASFGRQSWGGLEEERYAYQNSYMLPSTFPSASGAATTPSALAIHPPSQMAAPPVFASHAQIPNPPMVPSQGSSHMPLPSAPHIAPSLTPMYAPQATTPSMAPTPPQTSFPRMPPAPLTAPPPSQAAGAQNNALPTPPPLQTVLVDAPPQLPAAPMSQASQETPVLNADQSPAVLEVPATGAKRKPVANTGQGREKRHRSAAIGLETNWVTAVAQNLKQRVDDPRWIACVDAWVKFELARVVTTGRFPVTKSRPVEIAKWASKGGEPDVAPHIDDIVDFGSRWCLWWNEIQPEWRKNPCGCLPHSFDPSSAVASLAVLEKAGPKGIGMAMQSLSWWAGGEDTTRWWAAVDDIHRCLELFNKHR
ncbi:hypothetical protein CC1G_12407 [Coprinopsis cinerea okayama7|uniref:Uncharacterized protein n=1 Tax=Coprinopsis cinerea (strain Okayama-7 / 130 / ATCC MYA-4618 / FGSC 9003) TaxID=240176 RepID=A8P365_COPC7|nr:hypothetical protein CC1G_12407 [Coprinopsis cinerea okayama7\|eukprot:XP_001838483.2 hypothetical protein CC1G_12407 [Coprinopsis cinerea okayama7\